MLYYLTGMATERSAVLAYNLLHRGTLDLGEEAIAHTVIGQIKRQEPGHYAFYQLSARGALGRAGRLAALDGPADAAGSFAPVGANNAGQKADFGDVMAALGIASDARRLRRADRARREGAALGAGPRAQGPRLRLPRVPRGRRAGPRPGAPAAPAPLSRPKADNGDPAVLLPAPKARVG